MKKLIFLSLYWFSCAIFSQEPATKLYTLQECLSMALENNLAVKTAALEAKSARVNWKQSKANLLPSMNANYNLGVNNGRSIDPFTNDFIDQRLTFSNAAVGVEATIFNGFRLMNTLKQQQYNKQAAEAAVEEAQQNIALQVLSAYLQLQNSSDVLGLAKQQLAATQKQYALQKAAYEAESGNPADFADIKGQLVNDETVILNATNAIKEAQINLNQLLNAVDIPIVPSKEVVLPENYTTTVDEIYEQSLKNLGAIQSGELNIKAAQKAIKVAKANYIPEIAVFGQLNTNYSSVAETFEAGETEVVATDNFVRVNDEVFNVQTTQTNFSGTPINYIDQLENNLNTVVGLAVEVPIFNGFRAKNAIKLEKINTEMAENSLAQTKLALKNTIEQLWFNAQTAQERYQSFDNQVAAYSESFRINEIRLNNGVSNYLEYITSKNNLENAKINRTNAKYEYALLVKILNFYKGEVL